MIFCGEYFMKIIGKVVETEIPRFKHRWFGTLEVEYEKQRYRLYMSGTIAQWFIEGETVEINILRRGKRNKKSNTIILDFDDYELYRLWKEERIKVWPVFTKEVSHPRPDPLTGKILYEYKIKAREATFESDFEAIASLEQYHYASKEEIVAIWRCEKCGKFIEANTRPTCPNCRSSKDVHILEIRGSTPASRFLVLELLERKPYEPKIVAYVRVDPPVPSMHRRIEENGKISIEKNIREKVFEENWFHPVFWPEKIAREKMAKLRREFGNRIAIRKIWEDVKWEALKQCETAVSRIARVVVHPDYRADGLGALSAKIAVEWISERAVPEMKKRKHMVEVIAQMARAHPFFEKIGFKYVWDTAGGRPVLYYPITEKAREKLEFFLKNDKYASKHRGVLFRSRYGKVDVLKGPIEIINMTKKYESELDLEKLPTELKELLKAFGVESRVIEQAVFRDANIKINPGEVVVVVGASGAGKTTLARLIIGAEKGFERMLKEKLGYELFERLYKPDSGDVKLPENAKIAAIIPGEIEPSFDNLTLLEKIYSITRDQYMAVEVLNKCGLADAILYRAKFSELSTGQKERAKLAVILAERPNILVIDEFAAHLDVLTAQRVARKINEICRKAGITLIAITHRPEVLNALSPDKILYVGYGTLIEQKYK